jgi:GNAT superfamily N-acetyltransferase
MVPERLTITVALEPPSGPHAERLLWAYFQEMVSRYQLRPGRPDEVEGAMAEDPSDDLVPPSGMFYLARRGSTPVGCIGLRLRPNQVGQVTRVFVLSDERRRGVGARLMAEIEAAARDHKVRRLELDTRDDLVEARQLYESCGFVEVPAFNAGQYAEHWFAKQLEV